MIITFIFIIYICINPLNVEAIVDNDCIDDNTCMLVCSYNNNYETSSDYGTRKENRTRGMSLYYYFDSQEWELDWQHITTEIKVSKKGPESLNKIFSNNGTNVYYDKKPSVDNFTCPKNGYLDFSSLNSNNELCFDDDGKTCRDEYSNVGTTFGKGNQYKSTEKDYDYLDDLNNYFSNWSYGDITCKSIIDQKVDPENISSKIVEDVKINYLGGNDVPQFILNSSAFTNATTNAINNLKDKKEQCVNEIKEKQQNGEISEEEANRQIGIISGIDEEKAADNIDKALDDLNTTVILPDSVEIGCEDIFNMEEGKLGWLLTTILNYIKVIGPILVVLLSAVDFVKAVFSSDDKAIKEAQSKLIIRLIAAIALFLVPTLIQVLLSFINQTTCTL